MLILANKDTGDIGYIDDFCVADFDLNKDRTFSCKVARCNYDSTMGYGAFLYIEGTECGGYVERIITSTALDYIELKGFTCRGKLDSKIIEPPSGESHRIVSGDVYDIMRYIVNQEYDGLIMVKEGLLGKRLNDFRLDRYCTVLEGIQKMLDQFDMKLVIEIISDDEPIPHFELSAAPIVDYSEEIELSNDSDLVFTMDDNRMGVNHIVALGKGEGVDRKVIHRYADEKGNISGKQTFFGNDEITYKYDFSSCEDADLQRETDKKLQELMNSQKMSMDVERLGIDVHIGDIVGGRDYLTGISNKKAVENIIYSITNGVFSKTYRLEGET